jgi:TonB family protein
MPGKTEKFIHIPEYPGGTKALNQFIRNSVKIPAEAIKNQVKGLVQLEISVDYQGLVKDVKVLKPLGFGCDEEAVRVARLLRFLESFNRGLKVSRTLKIRIPFEAAAPTVQLKYSMSDKKVEQKGNANPSGNNDGYGYTITFS